MTHYETLGVDPTATADEIKSAYRQLARQYHPDLAGQDAAKACRMAEINVAYDVLSDERTRANYDLGLTNPIESGFAPGPEDDIERMRRLFGDDFADLVRRVRDEGITMHNLEDVVQDFRTATRKVPDIFGGPGAKRAGAGIDLGVEIEDILKHRFGIDLRDLSSGRGFGQVFSKIFRND